MNGLVFYHSSYIDMMHVAEAICEQIQLLGHNWSIQDIRFKFPDLNHIDFIIFGASAKIAKVTKNAISILHEISEKGFTGIEIAAFETCKESPVNPLVTKKANATPSTTAADAILEAATKLGFKIFEKALLCEIKEFQDRLISAEIKKAASFTEAFINSIVHP